MNKLILISIALLTSCSLFNDPEPISVTSTLGPNDVYNLAGGTGLELTQAGIVNLVTVPASVEGTVLCCWNYAYIILRACLFGVAYSTMTLKF